LRCADWMNHIASPSPFKKFFLIPKTMTVTMCWTRMKGRGVEIRIPLQTTDTTRNTNSWERKLFQRDLLILYSRRGRRRRITSRCYGEEMQLNILSRQCVCVSCCLSSRCSLLCSALLWWEVNQAGNERGWRPPCLSARHKK
jgi:hypothetical protein